MLKDSNKKLSINRTKLKRLQETSLAEAEVSERASAESASAVCSQTLLLYSGTLHMNWRLRPICHVPLDVDRITT